MINPKDKNLPEINVEDPQASEHVRVSRRLFLGGSAALMGAAGAIGAGMGTSLVPNTAHAAGKSKHTVGPGELDEYYGFWSGGHSGEVRILGIPSMRELMRIPVFNVDSATG